MTTGGTELIVVLAIAVVLFGPKKLPELARTIGQAVGEYQRATREFENEIRKTSSSIDREITQTTTMENRRPSLTGQAATTPASRSTNARPTSRTAQSSKVASRPAPTPRNNLKVKEIAKNLGISTDNKNENQILREIALKTKQKEG